MLKWGGTYFFRSLSVTGPMCNVKIPVFRDPVEIPNLLQHPAVVAIANQHKKTSAQVLLRYIAQLGIAVIPKSANPERICANFDVLNSIILT